MGISAVSNNSASASVQNQVTGQCVLGKGTCTNCGQCGKPVNNANNANTANSAANIGPAAVLTLSDKSVTAAAATSNNPINPYEKMNL